MFERNTYFMAVVALLSTIFISIFVLIFSADHTEKAPVTYGPLFSVVLT